jgi:pSer/pThr/pTyr-binding forkhead associated (FHA) protein
MTTALTWPSPASLNVSLVAPGRRVVIGRSAEADISIDDPRISREHLAITAAAEPNGIHRLEHLSHTNPTLVGGHVVVGVINIADGAVIQIGDASLIFHDLHARDRISGPVCHICGRENADADRDCWFCGTSLLNAPTTLREIRPVALRAVSSTGRFDDLYAGRWLALRPDGSVESLRDQPAAGTVAVHVENGLPTLLDSRAEPGSNPQQLVTGANVAVDDALFAFIAREGPAAK